MPTLLRGLIRSRLFRRLALLVVILAASARAVYGQTDPLHTLYFAEGATGFFTTSIDLVNPSASDTATATVTFVGDSGPVGTKAITLAPGASQSISLNTEVGALAPAGTVGGFGTIVESDIELAGERHMSWGEGGYGSSLERGVRQASTTWYFAEGATTIFDLYYLLLNPGPTAADVTIQFLREDGSPVTRTVTVAPRSRLTQRILDFPDPELQAASFGAALTSTVPIVVEQAMYLSSPTQYFGAGSASAATPTLATTTHFAEGATGFFDEFLLLINPSPSAAATATMLYRLPDGTTLSKAYAIAPERRLTVWLNQEAESDPALAALASTPVAVTVTSDVPVAVTRKMYWPTPREPGGWGEASDAAGITSTTLRASLAKAMVGGPDQAETYVLIANTSADAGQIQITLTPAAGASVVQTYPIPGHARLTVDLAWFGVVDQPFSVAIESLASPLTVPVVVEVAEYTSPGGAFWAAGGASAASVPGTPDDGGLSLTGVSPNIGIRGTTVAVTLTGTNFVVGATTVGVATGGVTVTNVTVDSSTSLTANFVIDPTAVEGARNVTVTTAAGTSDAQIFTVTVPLPPGTPTLTSVTPNAGTRGTMVPVTLTGTNFVAGDTTVTVGGSGVTVTGVTVGSRTSLTANFVIEPAATDGPRTVTVSTATGTSGPLTFTITASTPTLTSVSPNQGSRGTVVAVALTGTDFVAGDTTVTVGGSADVTVTDVAVSSSTSLTAKFAIAPTASDGLRTVTVTTVGGTSRPRVFAVIPPVPVGPTLTGVAPNQGTQGTTVAVTLTGTNFDAGATVAVSGVGVTVPSVTVDDATTLTASFLIEATAAVGPRLVTVTTDAGTSDAQTFTITLPGAPTLADIEPNEGVQGATMPITLTGTNFVAGATVSVSGVGVTVPSVTVDSATTLTASFVIEATAAVGPRAVTVTTTGGESGEQTFTIGPPPPTLTSVTPNQGTLGTIANVTLSGANFVVGATVVNVSGSDVTATNVIVGSSTSLTASVVIDPAAAVGARTVTVRTAGGLSGEQTFTINPRPPPTLTSVAPSQGLRGETVAVTLTGTNFVVGATTVAVAGGGGITVTNVSVASSTSLTASFALDLAASGPRAVTVTTDGGTSGTQPFTINLPVSGSATFSYTGGEQLFTVPAGVVSVTIQAAGAAGGRGNGAANDSRGMGGQTTATVSVVPGALLTVRVGGSGPDGQSPSTAGGFNGGGTSAGDGGGGGGASSVRDGSIPLVIAGGGGGGGGVSASDPLATVGGAGGDLSGAPGGSALFGGTGGGGGTQAAGGTGGTRGNPGGTHGTGGVAGTGGAGGVTQAGSAFRAGGGGGGGYFGGGGGGGGGAGFGDLDGGGGGGGSSFAAPGATGVVHLQGGNIGAGSVTISW